MVLLWLCEKRRRSLLTWLFDISKQIVANGYGKFWNISQSLVFARIRQEPAADDYEDECTWYLMSITLDCLCLTFLCCGLQTALRPILLRHCGVDVGDYTGDDYAGDGSGSELRESSETLGAAKLRESSETVGAAKEGHGLPVQLK